MISRYELLNEAAQTVTKRGAKYGTPAENFERIAVLWTALLGHEVSAAQVAMMMVAVKMARLCAGEKHMDSWVDIAGYAACGAEIVSAPHD
jgi:hypothetical protein